MAHVRLAPLPHVDFVSGVHATEIIVNLVIYLAVLGLLALLGLAVWAYFVVRDFA